MLALVFSIALIPDHLEDLRRFPPQAIVATAYDLASAHNGWLVQHEGQWPSHQANYYYAWKCEQRDIWAAWDALRDCYRDWPLKTRLQRLHDLRELLGDEAYYRGSMPLPVALGRFRFD